MDASIGNLLNSKTKVFQVYGSTEAGILGLQLESDKDAWEYIHLSEELSGIEMREVSPGIYELVFVRNPENEDKHFIWSTFPDLQEWSIKDLFRKHPTKPNHWLYEGRLDDLIVFRNISKFNPLGFEEELRTNPLIRYALIAGTGHEQTAALIELEAAATNLSREDTIDQIWPTIEAANKVAPKHALLMKTHILFAKDSKAFERTGKGTVQRNPTVRKYKEELDELYAEFGDKKLEGGAMPSLAPPPKSANRTAAANGHIERPVNEMVNDVASREGDTGLLRLQLEKLRLEKQKLEIEIQEVTLQIKLRETERHKPTAAN